MSNRPAIPIELSRAVLVEAGHRCAVCGVECPLERAHIIPWHASKRHRLADLICLCANCHERADKEKWGERALRQYKDRPWILRRAHEIAPEKPRRNRRFTNILITATGLACVSILVVMAFVATKYRAESSAMRALNVLGVALAPTPTGNLRAILVGPIDDNEFEQRILLVAQLSNLRELELRKAPGITDLEPLKHVPHLVRLDIHSLPQISDLRPIAVLSQLRHLELIDLPNVSVLSPLAALKALDFLRIGAVPRIRTLAFIARLQSLNTLQLRVSLGDG